MNAEQYAEHAIDVMYSACLDGRTVSLVVERKGRTDCRECALAEWVGVDGMGRIYDCDATRSLVYGKGPEYCGDFVEVVL
jgi:hypothetical protein